MGSKKVYAFDLDGTLLDTVPWFIRVYKETLKEVAGMEICTSDLLAALGPPEPEVFEFLAPKYKQRCTELFCEKSEKTIDEVSMIPGVLNLLEQLRSAEVPLGLVTSRGKPLATELLERFDLSRFFDHFYFGEGTRGKKVEDLIHLSEIEHASVTSSVYVGDFESDYTAASEAGFIPVVARWGTEVDSGDWIPVNAIVFRSTKKFISWINEREL